MLARSIVVVPVLLVLGVGQAQAVDQEKLRTLIELPVVSVMIGVGFQDGHFVVSGKASPAIRKEVLDKNLQGPNPDAQDFIDRAGLHVEAKETKLSEQLLEKAEAYFRKRVAKDPECPLAATQLGEIMNAREQCKEGEAMLRKATQMERPCGRAWIKLGWYLMGEGVQALKKEGTKFQFVTSAAKWQGNLPDEEQLKQARKHLAEGKRCFDQAVEVAPGECPSSRERFCATLFGAMIDITLRALEGQEPGNPMELIFAEEAKADLFRAFKADPNDLPTASFLVMIEGFSLLISGDGKNDEPNWDDLPEGKRKPVKAALKRLDTGTRDPDKTISGACAEVLSMLHFLLHKNKQRAVVYARKAIEIDPGRDAPRVLLEMHLDQEGKKDERESVCLDRVKYQDTAASRYLLAKAYFDYDKLDKAEQEMRVALKHDANDYHANLGLIAVLLKRPDGKIPFDEVDRLVPKVARLLERDGAEAQKAELTLMIALRRALVDDVKTARFIVSSLALSSKANQARAKNILECLGDGATLKPLPPK